MPVYQYACPDCGHQFEKQQKFTEEKIKVCPVCKKRRVHRVVGQVAVAFRGSGFYVNDSRGANPAGPKPAAKSPETSATDTKPAEAKPTESKPAEAKSVEAKPAESKPAAPAKTDS